MLGRPERVLQTSRSMNVEPREQRRSQGSLRHFAYSGDKRVEYCLKIALIVLPPCCCDGARRRRCRSRRRGSSAEFDRPRGLSCSTDEQSRPR